MVKETFDPGWDVYPLELWSYVADFSSYLKLSKLNEPRYGEISAGIVCGCVPALPAFIRYIRSDLVRGSWRTHSIVEISKERLQPHTRRKDDLEMLDQISDETLVSDIKSSV